MRVCGGAGAALIMSVALVAVVSAQTSAMSRVSAAKKTVANMDCSLPSQSSSLTRLRAAAGDEVTTAVLLRKVLALAMNSAAGTPLPVTSPTAKQNLPSPTE